MPQVESSKQMINIKPLSVVNQDANEACNFNSHVILMKGITWARDSHGLFDYESRSLTKKTMKTESEIIIMRKQNELSTFNYSKTVSFED